MPILVTGASGNVGREVVRALQRRGIKVRAAGTDPTELRRRLGSDVETAHLDFYDTSTYGPATRGCEAMFLLRPPAIANTKATLAPFVDAARNEGAGHIVFLSVQGAGRNKLVPHHAVEMHLRARGNDWTILRPGFFAQNLQDAYRRDILEDDRIYVPAGQGRVAFVDVRDVAEVAALAFADPGAHHTTAYTLTGPHAVAFDEIASMLSDRLGRTIRYVPASVPGYIGHLKARSLPWGQALVQTVLHVGLRFGQAEHVDPTLERLLGRPATPVRRFIEDHAALWMRDGSR